MRDILLIRQSDWVYVEKLLYSVGQHIRKTYVLIKSKNPFIVGTEMDEAHKHYVMSKPEKYAVTIVDYAMNVIESNVQGEAYEQLGHS